MHFLQKTFVLVAFLLASLAASADSSGSAGLDIRWHLDNLGNLTFSGSGQMKDFGRDLPYRPQLVKNVTISDGITSIGNNALRGCSDLESVEIPASVRSIGSHAFDGCKSLMVIDLPFGLVYIGSEAFRGCRLITELNLPGSVKSIDAKAFADCTSLVILRLPTSLKTIGEKAFDKCKNIEVIHELPTFVTVNSADRFKLNSHAVQKYWQQQGQTYAQTTATPAAVAAPAPVAQPAPAVNTSWIDCPEITEADEVDLRIPATHRSNTKTYAVIISNENYSRMERVPYAINDGNTFRLYCERTLGIPASNIFHYTNATSGIILEALSDLAAANRIVGSDMKVIFYYSGHGAPDENTLEGYLIPIDASRVSKACMPLSTLYRSLAELDIASATVFIDACFSGGERNGGALMAANGERGVIIKPAQTQVTGNIVVFSATSGDQTALPYAEKGHGLFTYFLLKKLNESRGNASLAEIEQYLRENVNQSAFSITRREQTPTVSTSPGIGQKWKNWRLNQ